VLLSAIFSGNAYAEIERDQLGRPFALWPIHSDRVTVCRDEAGQLEYEVSNGSSNKVILAARDMFHLAGPSLCGPIGLSLVSYARQTLGLALAQETFAGTFIRNQAAPSGMVKIKSPLSPEGFELMKAEFSQLNAGPRKAGKLLYADGDWEWVPLGVSPQDAEFLAQRRFAVEEIARWFGVPPQMIGDTSKQTFANFEQAGLNFLSLGLLPWIVRVEQEVNRKLLPRQNGRQPYLKINPAAIVRANLEAQYRAFALGRQWGWLSVNDIRRLIDMEPIGPEGDVYLQPMNMEPLGERSSTSSGDDAGLDRERARALRAV
jgi:HK97 family phage portal protein